MKESKLITGCLAEPARLACFVFLAASFWIAPARAQRPVPAPAQQPQPQAPPSRPEEQKQDPGSKPPSQPASPSHRFFDKRNNWLFAGVTASRFYDFASTKNFRSRGRDEILLTNDVVDNTPAFVAVELGGAAVSVGISYLFHRSGHHKLERWVSYLHISVTTFGASRNFLLKSNPAGVPTP